jgi:hypothetical protein
MAKTNGDIHQPLLPQLGRGNKRALKGPMPRHPINKAKSIGDNQDQDQGQNSPFHHIPPTKTHKAFFHIEDLSKSIHTGQTGAFLFTSQQGNRYIMVAIHLNANYIFVKTMQSRSKEEMIRAYKKIINRMRLVGLELKKHTLDNKALEAFKQCIQEQQMQYKLVHPSNHWHKQAEYAIQMLKAHFILTLASINDKFPLSLLCHLLKPRELTLNLLHQSKVAPKKSAYAHVHGPQDYMKKPFTPLGCAIQAHLKPEDRHTWYTQSDAGFSLGMSMEHHRCFRVYITKTWVTQISEKVFFKHQYITNPMVLPKSHVVTAAQQITIALQRNIPTGNKTAEALQKVSKLFTKIAMAKNEAAKSKPIATRFAQPKQHDKQCTFQGRKHPFQGWKHPFQG